MPNSSFRFKQFSVKQSASAMKVGTDGVLVGAWAESDNVTEILDIGSGTGLISLMLSQRFPKSAIKGVELDKDAYSESVENVLQSKWADRIQIINGSIQEFAEMQTVLFGLIVSNPPFYQTQYRPVIESRSTARHNDTLPFTDLLESAKRMLADDGRFCVILPADSQSEIEQLCAKMDLCIAKKCNILPTPHKPAKRLMYSIAKQQISTVSETIVVESHGRHQYSEEYKNLTKDFYLAF